MYPDKGTGIRSGSMASRRIVGPVVSNREDERMDRPSLWEYGQGVGRDREMTIAGRRIPAPLAVVIISAILAAVAAVLFLIFAALLPGV